MPSALASAFGGGKGDKEWELRKEGKRKGRQNEGVMMF